MTDTYGPDLIEALRDKIAAKQYQLASNPAGAGLVPLTLSCVMTSCQHGRHCFDHLRRPHKGSGQVPPGDCRDCGTHVVDFMAIERRYGDVDTLADTFVSQQNELIRAHYWNVPIDQWAYNQALRLGKTELHRRLETKVIEAMTSKSAFSGRGAAYSHQILAYAQHATATCCRRCAAYWHGLPADKDIAPTEAQLRHVVAMAVAYIDLRLPDLPETATLTVGTIRQSSLPSADERARLDEQAFGFLSDGRDPTGLLVPETTLVKVDAVRSGLTVSKALAWDVSA